MADEKKTTGRAYIPPSDHRLIVRPVITEKSTQARERLGKYMFEVREESTKHTIRRAVERLFDVKVRSVNLIRRHGKMRRVRQTPGWTKSTKRAVVTLEAGQKIAFFEGI